MFTKLFFRRNLRMFLMPFHHGLMFESKTGAYPSEHLSGAPLYVGLLALTSDLRLVRKGLAETDS